MLKRRLLSLILAIAMIGTMFTGLTVFAAPSDGEAQAAAGPTTLTVDPNAASETDTTFKTISAAVAKAKELKPSDASPVTININPGRYEEQVEISGMSYVTLQQAPNTDGYVELSWYYCTGYAAANCDLSGKYNPNIDWYAHPPKDDSGKEYKLGEAVPANTKLTYTTVDGKSVTETVSRATELGNTGGMDKMAALLVQKDASNITIKDLHIINSVPVMVTQGQKDAHLTPLSSYPNLPARDVAALTVSENGETTTEAVPEAFKSKAVTKDLFDQEVTKGTKFSSGESTWLARSGAFNERGHAVACCGDKVTFDNIYLRGGQDSLYIAGENRMYFKNSTIIGGTDYIYGSATAVFDSCKLGLEGFSDKSYGSPIATASTPTKTPYGYLFYNCTLYNVRDNNGANNFGGSWNSDGQVTYYKCKLDDNKTVGKSNFQIVDKGWGRFNAELGLHRLYEYGTTNNSGKTVDLSKRVVNKSLEEGGPGMGTVLDDWQILEFNPRNYFAKKNGDRTDDWDPMGVSSKYANVDAAINGVQFNIPSNESTEIDLPTPPANVEYMWKSASPNAVVKDNKLIVTRPAAGEPNINSEITLYVRDKSDNAIGDKTTVPIEITPTTNTTDVFNIPVKITSSLALTEANDFTITISKNGAPIKTQVVTMEAGKNEATATIENIPANAEGIDYDVKIVSKSDELTITSPESGETQIKGKTGQAVQLNISAQMLIDDTVELGNSVNYSSSGGAKTVYNLIDLAKNAGADESVATSDQITVEYDLTVPEELKQASSNIDLIATTPAENINTNAVNSRFAFWRLYKGWNQIDMADCNTAFAGTSNTDDQWLNIAGKFDYKTVSHITTTIDYKNQVVSAAATGSGGSQSVKEFTFKSFPSNYERGKLFLAMYPAGPDVWTISNVKVTYKKLVTSEPTETQAPASQAPATDAPATDTPATQAPATQAPATQAPATATPAPATAEPMEPIANVDFTKMTTVPVYSEQSGSGFVSKSDAIMPDAYRREVADTSKITIGEGGASVTESDGTYLYNKASDDYNNGGLIYRYDTGAPGAYHLEVEVADAANTWVAPTGMEAGRLTGTSTWDNCGNVPRTVSASWSGNVWSYDFATDEDFIEIEIEPNKLPAKDAAQTVGVKSIKITPLGINPAGDKPTIHILGDSTQKTYSFNETISSWGQTLYQYFDANKVNVVNYSMGGRAMKSNYNEGRTDEPLIRGKKGDYVFIHSAHNDETVSTGRFVRGASVGSDLQANNDNYDRWLDMYVKMIKARGMTPVLVTAMPRTGSGKYSESSTKPNGFNPDSPGRMRAKAASDPEIGLVELYAGAKAYIDKLDANEVYYIYNTYEAGETPADGAANGNSGDGTHYREAAARQWCRIMLQSMYDQSVAGTDTYTDKNIMTDLVSYMPVSVQNAAKSGDWSDVFPEMAGDVSAVDVVPGAEKQAQNNYYYRPNIEKALQIGALHKDKDNNFKPTQTITVGEFARGMETVFGLPTNTLNNYVLTYDELNEKNAQPIEAASIQETAQAAAGDLTVTVDKPEGGSIMLYNESQRVAKTADVPAGVTSKQVISDNEFFKLTAPEEAVSKSRTDAVFTDNPDISINSVEFRNSGTKEVTYEAKATGTLTVYCYFQDHKNIECMDTESGDIQAKLMNDALEKGDQSWLVGTVHFNVEAGKTYQLYGRGGTAQLFGVMYEAEYPQSDTSLAANSGDQIRIVASADSGYVFGSILINGKQAATTKEYIITVTENTTVSATFEKEPDVVDQTLIASDAALTREAMGAILYDAYLAAYGKNEDGSWNKVPYMNQNGTVPSPDDPNYDPNIDYTGTPYIPLIGWGKLPDTDQIETSLYMKVKEAYNLGLMRVEEGASRGVLTNGDEEHNNNHLQPKAEVTRAKAAKTLVFCYILTQPLKGESQLIPDNTNKAAMTAADIAAPNEQAPSTPYTGISEEELPTPVPATPTPEPTEEPTLAPDLPTPTPGTDVTPEPGESSAPEETAAPTPGTDATPTPGTDVTPEPGTDATPTPGTDITPEPGTDATPTPGTDATPTPGTDATPEPTATPKPLDDQKFDGAAPEDVIITLPDASANVSRVTLNGAAVPADSYKVENGVITFTPEFLSALPNGTNTVIIEDDKGNTYSVDIEVTNTFEPTSTPAPTGEPTSEPSSEPTKAPLPTHRPSSSYGGTGTSSNFSTGGSAATATPAATSEPGATSEPSATLVPGTGATAAPVQPGTQVFEDVPESYWAYGYIMDLYNAGIINGETPTLFMPENPITRAEFTKIAVMLFGITPGGALTFADVADTDWFAPYVAAGQSAGIVNGTSETTFSPDDNITREQIAAIVGRHLNLSSQTAVNYSDAAAIEDYALPYVAALSEQGILTGDNGMFNPKAPATRAEAATIMSRVKNQ